MGSLRQTRLKSVKRIREIPRKRLQDSADLRPKVRKGSRVVGDLRTTVDYARLRNAREIKRKLAHAAHIERGIARKAGLPLSQQGEEAVDRQIAETKSRWGGTILGSPSREQLLLIAQSTEESRRLSHQGKKKSQISGLRESARRLSDFPPGKRQARPKAPPLVSVLIKRHNIGKSWKRVIERMTSEGLITLTPSTDLRAALSTVIAPHNPRVAEAIKNERKVRLPRGQHKLVPMFRLIQVPKAK